MNRCNYEVAAIFICFLSDLVGRDDDAGGDVDPPPHAARIVLDLAVGGLGEAEGVQKLRGSGASRALVEPEEPGAISYRKLNR
mgnify:CR=1 FL=1